MTERGRKIDLAKAPLISPLGLMYNKISSEQKGTTMGCNHQVCNLPSGYPLTEDDTLFVMRCLVQRGVLVELPNGRFMLNTLTSVDHERMPTDDELARQWDAAMDHVWRVAKQWKWYRENSMETEADRVRWAYLRYLEQFDEQVRKVLADYGKTAWIMQGDLLSI